MTTRSREHTEPPTSRARLRFELIFGSIWLAVGLFVVPALVYVVGMSLLGPYGENAGLGTFYGAFFADLASGASRTWLLALGPLLLVSLVRALFVGVGQENGAGQEDTGQDLPDEEDPPQDRTRRPSVEKRRVEPRIGG